MGIKLDSVISLYNQNDFLGLIKLVEKERKKISLSSKFYYYLALAYMQVRDFENALLILDIVIASNIMEECMIQCRILKGYALSALERFQRAEHEFVALIDKGHSNTMIHSALGHVLFKRNKLEDALKHLNMSLKLDPDNISALNSICFIYAEHGLELENATSYMEKVLKREPRNPVYLDTYGYILYKLGKHKDAEKVLMFAYKLDANDTIKEHLDLVASALNV